MNLEIFTINNGSAIPKFLQVALSITKAINRGTLKDQDLMPSIIELSTQLDIAKATVEKCYRYLVDRGLLYAKRGKGYYVTHSQVAQQKRMLLLFNKISEHKQVIFESFIGEIGNEYEIDLFIYDNDYQKFESILLDKLGQYDRYVVIPHFFIDSETTYSIMNRIPKDKLFILDRNSDKLKGCYGAVFQNFEKDIYIALNQAKPILEKYSTLKIVIPKLNYFPIEMYNGFKRFAEKSGLKHDVFTIEGSLQFNLGDVFITLTEDDLVAIVEQLKLTRLEPGKDVGIISYNELPIKKYLLNGITTISTDFSLMGSKAAQMILCKSKQHFEVPFKLTLRGSL